jgi:hypothetical protein
MPVYMYAHLDPSASHQIKQLQSCSLHGTGKRGSRGMKTVRWVKPPPEYRKPQTPCVLVDPSGPTLDARGALGKSLGRCPCARVALALTARCLLGWVHGGSGGSCSWSCSTSSSSSRGGFKTPGPREGVRHIRLKSEAGQYSVIFDGSLVLSLGHDLGFRLNLLPVR